MNYDTTIAIIDTQYPVAAVAVGKLDDNAKEAVLTSGGDVVLKSGKSPNGMDCTVVARFGMAGKCEGYFAIAGDGREQPIARNHIDIVISKVA